jgi:hypothetical protein
MTKWISCSTEKTKLPKGGIYTGDWHINNPINIDMCFTVGKGQWLPNYPEIWFSYANTRYEWIYTDETKRDDDFNTIMKLLDVLEI